jgi:uncharacterized protein (TIGR02266 family)
MQDEAALLSALESEALLAEAQLEQDLAMARRVAEQADLRLRTLRAAAEKGADADKELALVSYQLGRITLPRFDDEEARMAALHVRRVALAQRKAARASFQAALESFGKRTAELELQLKHQEQWLTRAQSNAEKKAAARPVMQLPAPAIAAPVNAPAHPPRRESPRVSMCAEVDLSSDSNFYAGFSTNLSEGGLFIATVSAPPKGTQVELSFTLPGGDRLKARGVVRWTREVNDNLPDMMPGAGVQFVDLPPEVAQSITEFVMLRDPLFYVD